MTPDQHVQAAHLGITPAAPFPTPAQWHAVMQEIVARPMEVLWGAVYWLIRSNRKFIVTGGWISEHQAYLHYKGKVSPNGVLWDVNGAFYDGTAAMVSTRACYREGPNGVETMGLSTFVHEEAHLLDHVLGLLKRGMKLSDTPEWRAVYEATRFPVWWQPEPRPGEAWADGWAAWCQWLAGNPLGRLHLRAQATAMKPVWDYFHGVVASVGWVVPRFRG